MARTDHGLPGIYNASQITLADGNGAALALDVNGNVLTSAGGNVASGATDSGNPVKVGGKYNSTPITLTNGQRGDLQMDAAGNTLVSLNTLLAGEDLTANVLKTEQRSSYSNISASTLIKTGSGRLFGFIVNSHTSGTLKLWDNTSAATTIIFNTITFAAGPNFVVFPVAVEFSVGLFATVGGTIDCTILYK